MSIKQHYNDLQEFRIRKHEQQLVVRAAVIWRCVVGPGTRDSQSILDGARRYCRLHLIIISRRRHRTSREDEARALKPRRTEECSPRVRNNDSISRNFQHRGRNSSRRLSEQDRVIESPLVCPRSTFSYSTLRK